MKDAKTFVKCVTVLACIALVAGILLGLVSQVTAISEEEQAARAVKKIEAIRAGDYRAEDLSAYETNLERGRVSYLFSERGETVWYAAVTVGYGGYGGEVELFVLLEGDVVREIGVGSNKETPGISDNALKNESYFAQYKGKTVARIAAALSEGGAGIENASGATYSSRGTKNAMAALAEFLCGYFENEGGAA